MMTYRNNYRYDNQYRLVRSDGRGDFLYNIGADYSPAGRLGSAFHGHTSAYNANVIYGYHNKRFTPRPVVRDMQYDPMDHNIYRIYGNSVWSDYNYEPYRNRLAGLRTNSPSSCMLQDIKYSYDNVGNILYMQQLAPACIGMGGEYDNIYKYDLQYRLEKSGCAMGNYQYDIDMAYSRAGRLGHNWGNNSSATSVMAEYGYDSSRYTHQPRVVFDYKSKISASLFWDANGNLAQVTYCDLKQGRFHDWDEENRLRMVVGNKQAGYYGYDANNERVYKLTGESTLEYVGEHKTHAGVLLDNAVLYPNPYIVITPKGYTKHYYANGERLATVLGQGGFGRMYSDVITHFNDTLEENLWGSSFKRYENEYPFEYLHETYPVTKPNVDIADRYIPELEYQCGEYHLSGLKLQWDKNILLYTIEAFQTVNDKETDIFYTHNNHLGSAAWITRFDGKPVQYMHYLPYGQLLANQTPTGYDERYKFIGKERDYESGYDFFGARFYIPPFIHFGSVEPLLDKYLHISPYAYCHWNPINRIDPDGMDDEQRETAVNMANQYVKMNPSKSSAMYKWGEKGGPGQKVDCSGLVSYCVVAGGEKDPNRGKDNGVRNIAYNSQKIEDMNDLVAGNLVTFNTGGKYGDYSHIGIISDVMRDKEGKVVGFQFIHSASSTGPTQNNYNDSYWRNRISGFYKWDTRPDVYNGPTLSQVTVLGNKPSQIPMRALNVTPVSININPYIRR